MEFWIVQAQENLPEHHGAKVVREWRSNTLGKTLADRGHNVVRWRSSFCHQAKQQLVDGSVRVATDNYYNQFIEAPSYRRHVGLKRVLSHRALGKNFTKIAKSYPKPPDVIHVANVPIELCRSAVLYGKEKGVPVIVDIRDLWPDIYADLIPDVASAVREFVRLLLRRRSGALGAALAEATAITALTQPYLDWALNKAKRSVGPWDAIFPMSYPRLEDSPSKVAIASLRTRLGLGERDVLGCYIGNIGYQSDFECLIESARLLADRQPNFKIVLAGSGPMLANLKALVRGQSNVILPGWLSAQEVHALMHLSTFGLIAYKSSTNFLNNIPNKFPEYLAGNLVLACGLHGEMGRLVDDHNCGFVYKTGDAANLAQTFDRLLNDPNTLKKMAENASMLHRDAFDSATIQPKFSDYLEDIGNRHMVKGRG